ncbi:MAG: peptidoglycan-associated lipoprotein Pal [Terriglobia bacterium]
MQKTTVFIELLAVLVLAVLLSACHKSHVAAGIPAAPGTESPTPPPPLPPTCSLTAEPATVEMGKSVTLTWASNNATALDLEPGLGKQQAEGSTTATPQESTSYTLSVTGSSGSGTCTARVTVTPPVAQTGSVSESNLPPGGAGAASASPLQDIYFDFNQSTLRPEAEQTLTQNASYLKGHPDAKVRIEGYCDQRGSEEYNLGLGDRRATAAKNYLANLGISADRVATLSYGKDKPFCTETTDECYQQNRRDHLVLLPAGQ